MKAVVGNPQRPRLDVDIALEAASVVGVIGPNGAGKTTLLRTVAGLESPSPDSRLLLGTRAITSLAPSHRSVAYVPQGGALFPHLSVRDNVAYGARAHGARRAAARQRADQVLGDLGIANLADRSITTLSGGEARRVSIARALAIEPGVLLLDEPTASLDASGHSQVRRLLRDHLSTFTGVTLLVTHDASDVLTLSDRVLVLDRGELIQDASADQLVHHPTSAWVADMLRLNAWSGTVTSHDSVALAGGGVLNAVDLPAIGEPVMVTVSPTALVLFPNAPAGSLRNVWPAHVDDLTVLGDRVRATLVATTDGPQRAVVEVTRAAATDLDLEAGTSLYVGVKATELSISLM